MSGGNRYFGCFAVLVLFFVAVSTQAQVGTVIDFQKISDTAGGFTGVLDDEDSFGFSVESIGDLDGDGIDDMAVGAPGDDDGKTVGLPAGTVEKVGGGLAGGIGAVGGKG